MILSLEKEIKNLYEVLIKKKIIIKKIKKRKRK